MTTHAYTIAAYDGSTHPALEPHSVSTARTLREARRCAAEMLGHATLRGARTWESLRGEGSGYRFGGDADGYDYVVITSHDCSDLLDEGQG